MYCFKPKFGHLLQISRKLSFAHTSHIRILTWDPSIGQCLRLSRCFQYAVQFQNQCLDTWMSLDVSTDSEPLILHPILVLA